MMGLLDDLKKKAEQVKAQQEVSALTPETVVLVDGRMKLAFTYLNELLNQLKVLKPANPVTYVLPGIGEIRSLAFEDAFADYRRRRIFDKERFDTIKALIRWHGPDTLVVERDMPGTIERTREALWHCRAKFEEDETRTEFGTVRSVRFRIQSAIVTEVDIRADYEHRRLQIRSNNLLRSGPDHFELPVAEVDEHTLEGLARMMLGEATDFRRFRCA